MCPEACARRFVISPLTQTWPTCFSSSRFTCDVNSLTDSTRRVCSVGNNSPKSHWDFVCLLMEQQLLQLLDPDVAKRHRPVIALQEDRARLIHLVVNFAAGGLAALDVVMSLHAVLHDGDSVADDRSLDRLPFAAGLGNEFVRRLEV